MRVKIVSDGTRLGTKVVDAQTGEAIEGVVGVGWRIAADGNYGLLEPIPATLQVLTTFEIEAEAEVHEVGLLATKEVSDG